MIRTKRFKNLYNLIISKYIYIYINLPDHSNNYSFSHARFSILCIRSQHSTHINDVHLFSFKSFRKTSISFLVLTQKHHKFSVHLENIKRIDENRGTNRRKQSIMIASHQYVTERDRESSSHVRISLKSVSERSERSSFPIRSVHRRYCKEEDSRSREQRCATTCVYVDKQQRGQSSLSRPGSVSGQ